MILLKMPWLTNSISPKKVNLSNICSTKKKESIQLVVDKLYQIKCKVDPQIKKLIKSKI